MSDKISIEYCTTWGYLGRAVALARNLLNEHKNDISELSLIPSSGGVFEVKFGDELIFSKKQKGDYADKDEIEDLIREKLK